MVINIELWFLLWFCILTSLTLNHETFQLMCNVFNFILNRRQMFKYCSLYLSDVKQVYWNNTIQEIQNANEQPAGNRL